MSPLEAHQSNSRLAYMYSSIHPTKLKLSRALVLSVLLYRCKSLTLRAEMEKRIQAFEMKCFQRLLHISWTEHRSSDSVWLQVATLGRVQGPLLANSKKEETIEVFFTDHPAGCPGGRKVQKQTEEKLDREHQRLDWSRFASAATGDPKQTEMEEVVCSSISHVPPPFTTEQMKGLNGMEWNTYMSIHIEIKDILLGSISNVINFLCDFRDTARFKSKDTMLEFSGEL